MKELLTSFLLWAFLVVVANGQRFQVDSLKTQLTKKQPDTSRILTMIQLADVYSGKSPDSSLLIAQEAVKLAKRVQYINGQMRAMAIISTDLRYYGNLPKALAYEFDILRLVRATRHRLGECFTLNNIGTIYGDLGEYRQALTYFIQSKAIAATMSDPRPVTFLLPNIANAYIELGLLDSAQFVNRQAYQLLTKVPDRLIQGRTVENFGRIAALSGHSSQAFRFFREAIQLLKINAGIDDIGNTYSLSRVELEMAELFDKLGQTDSSLYYSHRALLTAQDKIRLHKLKASNLLIKYYKAKNRIDSAFYYQEIARTVSDSLFGLEKFQQLQKLVLTEQQNQQALIADQEKYQNRIQVYSLVAGLGLILLIALFLFLNNRRKTKTNLLLNQQNEEINRQRDKAESALSELKITQAQLIQKEKLASLGELTAGIAHEIQNPLNFVNNFSEVSTELIDELKEGPFQKLPDNEKEYAEEILGDLSSNLKKIHHHGGRASSIVKGMLEHSRTESGEKRPTDLNALADEYLKIAYHGLRAKDKAFNCELVTDFDSRLGKVDVAPQEIGRVLLNLYNNAFYAVSERQKQGGNDFHPRVRVTTKRLANSVEIRVRDNGTGIPESVKAKIFQPFFTTKPTGEGTGLGLSLSYDIVTKGHGGTLSVKSQEGQGTEFIIHLSIPKKDDVS